jgi:hypothetical protein
LRWGALFVLLGLVGCRTQVADPGAAQEDQTTRLGDKVDISLADWLNRPRAELAKLADDLAVSVQKQQESVRSNADAVDLLPQLHASVRVPVFERCSFRPAIGISLPPYIKDGANDLGVALHLARHGDREGALKLVDATNKDLVSQIDAWKAEKNYPLEWARLVSLTLQQAQFKMAHGDIEGATELVLLHKQLRELLDARAAGGPLGAALLPVGRRALQQAVAAWREPKVNKTALARDVEVALAEWGEPPAPVSGLAVHAKKAEVVSVFGNTTGRSATAASPDEVQRALDLLAVPVPSEGAKAVLAFLDAHDRLDEVLVLYRPKINEVFPEPADLAHHLIDHGFPGGEPKTSAAIRSQVYEGGGLAYDVSMLTRGNAAGALLTIAPPKAKDAKEPPAVFTRDPRDFGAVNLDRTYQTNRATLNPFAESSSVKVDKKEVLQKISQPCAAFAPVFAEVVREPNYDLVQSLVLKWSPDVSQDALYRLGVPLWSAYGRGRLEAPEGANGGSLQLTWEGNNTRLQLQLPADEQPPQLVVQDTRGSNDLAARAEAALKRDLEDRKERLAADKPLKRLPRNLQVNNPHTTGLQAEGLQLGMSKAEALAALPSSQTVRKSPLNDGISLLFLADPPATAPYWARQMFVRFDAANRVAEVRIRYQEGPARPTSKFPALFENLRSAGGYPEELTGTWSGLWPDLGGGKKPALYRWRDDLTVMTMQRDEGGAEVVLRDCSADKPFGVELRPLQFCNRGVKLCALGDSREQVLKNYRVTSPPTVGRDAEVGEVFTEPPTSPYDVLVVWYDKGHVSRITARHRAKASIPTAEVVPAIQRTWSQDIDHLGYVRRIDSPNGPVLGAYGWHDDVTRVRALVQDGDGGPALWTEFRNWPVAVPTVTAKAP